MPIFISYSFKDNDVYKTVIKTLQADGFECWDTKQMRLATSLADQLRRAISKCDACIYIATKNSTKSKWCAAETGAFWGARKKVFILQADPNIEKDELPPPFREDLMATDVGEIIRDLKRAGIAFPDYSPAVLFFFSSIGYTSNDKGKVDIIRRTMMQPDLHYKAFPQIPLDELGKKSKGKLKLLDHDNLSRYKGLFLGMPYKEKLSESGINRIVKWVHAGGNLVITCFELGERHHMTNINQLAYHFGIKFNSDVVVGPSADENKYIKDYNVTLVYNKIDNTTATPLFEGVTAIAMRNSCTLSLEPGASPLVWVSPNKIKELEIGDYTPDFALATGVQPFHPAYTDEHRAVIALAPEGLTLKGRVLAIGTWDFQYGKQENDNERFLYNLGRWLSE